MALQLQCNIHNTSLLLDISTNPHISDITQELSNVSTNPHITQKQINILYENNTSMPITEAKCQYKPRDVAFLGLSLTAELLADICSLGGDSVGVIVEYVTALFLPRPLPDKLPTTQAPAAFSPSYTLHDNAISHHYQPNLYVCQPNFSPSLLYCIIHVI